MACLKTSYLGLELKNPLVVSSSPLTNDVESVAKLEQSGAAAVVMRSIFEEQIASDVSDMYAALEGETSAAALEYLRADLPGQLGPESYLDKISDMRKRVKIPIIASVNCVDASKWVTYAKKIEHAGADALELNLYHMPVNPDETSDKVEARRMALVKAVLAEVRLPVAVKLSQHYTALLPFVRMLDTVGVKGLVFFNRFLQTDVDTASESMFYAPNYSSPKVLHSQLRWTAIVREWVRCSIAVSGGIHSSDELVKALLVGADVGYLCSALYLREDFGVIQEILDGLSEWMGRKGYSALDGFRGKLRERDLTDGVGFERAQYVRTAAQLA